MQPRSRRSKSQLCGYNVQQKKVHDEAIKRLVRSRIAVKQKPYTQLHGTIRLGRGIPYRSWQVEFRLYNFPSIR